MTDPSRPGVAASGRRRAARRGPAIALIPAVAAVFGGSLAWAGQHDPLAAAEPSAVDEQVQPEPGAAAEQAVADLTARVRDARARVAALTATVAEQREAAHAKQAADAAQASAAQAAAAQAAAAKAAAQASAAQRRASAPAPPRVHVVTRASG